MTKGNERPVTSPSETATSSPVPPPAAKKTPEKDKEHGRRRRTILIETIVAAIGVILILVWLAGGFHAKVPPTPVEPPGHAAIVSATTQAAFYTIPRYEWAIGTIQAVHETAMGSKILAKVIQADIKAGQIVKQNDVLMKLDDADLKAKVAQSEAAVEVAKAKLSQAKLDYDRVMKLASEKAAAEQEINTTTSSYNAAKARLLQSQSALHEAQTLLAYTVIRAPFGGVIIDKKVEAGDTVIPGQILLRLYDPRQMQLVASVRESLAADLKVGQNLNAFIPALKRLCCGTIAEIVPQAQAVSRSFDIKVVGPCAPGIYTGMFGRLLIPLGEERVLLIPQAAITQVGQLTLVNVVETDPVSKIRTTQRRSVQLGRVFEDYVEVLSGLDSGTQISIPGKKPLPVKTHFMPTYLWEGLPITDACVTTRPAK